MTKSRTPQCEALTLKMTTNPDGTVGAFKHVRCSRKATGFLVIAVNETVTCCTQHCGMYYVYGALTLVADEPGYVREAKTLAVHTLAELTALKAKGQL